MNVPIIHKTREKLNSIRPPPPPPPTLQVVSLSTAGWLVLVCHSKCTRNDINSFRKVYKRLPNATVGPLALARVVASFIGSHRIVRDEATRRHGIQHHCVASCRMGPTSYISLHSRVESAVAEKFNNFGHHAVLYVLSHNIFRLVDLTGHHTLSHGCFFLPSPDSDLRNFVIILLLLYFLA